ncbi:hypothetical protein RA265_28375, partial [Pseudomonas syringae pv. tagetis]|uniref:hypothetical protein n=1 Tax=Pseudomonas syringae group genomosp. 7 TaxID=251699 RepID=UPI00377035A7
ALQRPLAARSGQQHAMGTVKVVGEGFALEGFQQAMRAALAEHPHSNHGKKSDFVLPSRAVLKPDRHKADHSHQRSAKHQEPSLFVLLSRL